MRKELIKTLKKLFDEGVKAQLPEFIPFKMEQKGTVRLAPVCRWYRRKVAQDLSFFLILQPNTKEGDELWVHVAWSRTEDHSDLDGNFDHGSSIPEPHSDDG
jgi:hypothetical protein